MNTLIFFSITSGQDFNYGNALLSRLKEHYPTATFFDFDNHSDAILFGYYTRILEENKKENSSTVLIIESKDSSTKGVIPFCETLLRSKDKVKPILIGEHTIVEKMLSSVKGFTRLKNPDDQELLALLHSSSSNESASR